jgi:predicted ester cyclase
LTGKHISVAGTSFYHVRDGKMVDDYPGFDALSLMQQLGAIPTPELAGV